MPDRRPAARIVLIRHGESTFNATKVFTGLLDAPLSVRGRQQIATAAGLIAQAHLHPSRIISSPLQRAHDTAAGLQQLLAPRVPIETSWRLAERDYGCMTGVSKHECRQRWGDAAFFAWRRTMHGAPPPASEEQRSGWPHIPTVDLGPLVPGSSECLADVVERVRWLWADVSHSMWARPDSLITIVAHGNSLRALSLLIGRLSDEEVEGFNIPAAQPLVYEFDEPGDLQPRNRFGRYLDPATATIEAARVEAEGGT
ncbi:2,3-bisphosphoglycerate-dependent phosphoglycerate mutase [Propionibacterium cyclohexanicum]|mgnify:CR=1 FL=1|uniref:2,3-bisphosphoglycerate-dependent phosphoglycerate mutase n=2 Tax=Propionibacterium cyclohexanicum TaxID=64702 RepID=A0A1H9TER8_9ACTN|nr:2,3-bisphosphoglycerate-dependent phosphoglycerate mutase [Propionibacterium cyclohexanicum]